MSPLKRPRKRQRAQSSPHPSRRSSQLSPFNTSNILNSDGVLAGPSTATNPASSSSVLPASLSANDDVVYNSAVLALLQRLEAIRSDVLSLRDEHLRAAADIQQNLTAKAIATSAASRVKPVRPSDSSLDFATAENASIPPTFSSQVVPPSAPDPPTLPTMALITEPPPSEKIIQEQSIIIRAQAITRKNAELARERLPKQPEAQRNKTWRDYFLDEVVWMATDFREERKWKLQIARKLAKSVAVYHQQKAQRFARTRLEQHHRTVRQANAVARDVRKFWSQIREIADFRLSRTERARRLEQSQIDLNKFLERTQRISKELALGLLQQSSISPEHSQSQTKEQSSLQSRSQSPARHARTNGDAQVRQVRFADLPTSNLSSATALPSGSIVKHPSTSEPSRGEKSSRTFSTTNGSGNSNDLSAAVQAAFGNSSDLPEDSNRDLKITNSEDNVISTPRSPAPCAPSNENLVSSHSISLSLAGAPVQAADDRSMLAKSTAVQGNDTILKNSNGLDSSKLVDDPSGAIVDAGMEGTDSRERDRPSDNVRYDKRAEKGVVSIPIRVPADLLRGTLRGYQYSGMQWLVNLYKNNSNGILADEMGLGKTIQTISLLAWLAIEQHQWGPHLIIVPTSVMVNWEVEFKRWLPGFKILTYFGNTKERKMKRKGWTDPELFHVCITSYTLAVQDIHILRRRKWFYLILDEAHNIKNFRSQRWQTLLTLSSQRRLLLTGTPLQNSVMELWSLMHFLMPSLFESQAEFKDWFMNPLQSSPDFIGDHSKVVNQLHSVLRPFVLRRLKIDVEKGLPPKFEHVVKCRLSKRQRELYEDFLSRSDVRDNLNSGDMFKVMNVLMQLRKVCNHPDLFEGRPILSPFAMSSIFYPVPALVTTLFPDSASDCLNLGLMNIDICTRELTWPGRWQSAEDETISVENVAQAVLHERMLADEEILRHEKVRVGEAGLRRKERTLAFRRSTLFHLAVVSAHRVRERGLLGEDVRSVCSMTPTSLMESIRLNSSFRSDFVPDTTPNLVPSLECISVRATEVLELFVCCITKASSPTVEFRYQGDDKEYSRWCDDFLLFNRMSSPYRSLFRSYEVRSQVTIPDKRLVQWDCGKLQHLDSLLRDLQHRGSRVLIFTQMTKMLDILESFLNLHTFRYLRLDGATKTDDRQKVVHRFNTDMKIFCMILTTRAGGVGLNLTGADSVIFYDTDYNPSIDNQAQDRAHRIGQTRPVHVYRLICEQTVEEGILSRARQKQKLETKIISEAGFTTEAIVSHEFDSATMNRPKPSIPASHGSASESQDDRKSRILSKGGRIEGLESAHGIFRGFGSTAIFNSSNEKGISVSAGGALSNVEALQNLTDKVIGDDDRERFDMDAAAEEQKLLEAEFKDVGEDDFESPGIVGSNTFASSAELDLENVLSPVQVFALQFIEGNIDDAKSVEAIGCKSHICVNVVDDVNLSKIDDRDGRETSSVGVGCLKDDNQSTVISGASVPDGGDKHGTTDNDEKMSLPGQNNDAADDDDDDFYELDITEEGRLNYLKALTDTDVDIKLYLPLRDGGPEELKVSSVVCGTAAAGLECAEDAAFFPHAYNRMSRTQYATRRQKEKSLAVIRKRMVEKEARKFSSDTSAPVAGGSLYKRNPMGSIHHNDSTRKHTGLVGSASGAREVDGNFTSEMITDANRASDHKSVLPVMCSIETTNIGITSTGLQHVFRNDIPDITAKGLSAGERARLQKQKFESVRGNGTVAKKIRNNIEAGVQSGLFKKSSKKLSRKAALNNLKVASTAALSGAIGITGCNDGWTKEEDEQLISFSDRFANNMLLVSDSLSLENRVAVGLRRRRTSTHCTQRVCKLVAKDKTSQTLVPIAESKDCDLEEKHISALLSTFPHQQYVYTTGQALETAGGDVHASQRKIIADAHTSIGHDLSPKELLTHLESTLKATKISQNHRPGTKPREGASWASHRRKRPFLQPIKDDLLSKNSFMINQYGSGMQVNGSGSGVIGVETGEAATSRPSSRLPNPDSGPVGFAGGRAERSTTRVGSANIGVVGGDHSQNALAGTGRGRGISSSGVRSTAAGRIANSKLGNAPISSAIVSGKTNVAFPPSKKAPLASGTNQTGCQPSAPGKNRAGAELHVKGPVPGNPKKDLKKSVSSVKSVGLPGRAINPVNSGVARAGVMGGVPNGSSRPAGLKGSVGRGGTAMKMKIPTNRIVAGKQKTGVPITPGVRGRGISVGPARGMLKVGSGDEGAAVGSKSILGMVTGTNGLTKVGSGKKTGGVNRGAASSLVTAGDTDLKGDAKMAGGSSAVENTKAVCAADSMIGTSSVVKKVATTPASVKIKEGIKASVSTASGSGPTDTGAVTPLVASVESAAVDDGGVGKGIEGTSRNGYVTSDNTDVPRGSNKVPNAPEPSGALVADEVCSRTGEGIAGGEGGLGAVDVNETCGTSKEESNVETKNSSSMGETSGGNVAKMNKEISQVVVRENDESGKAMKDNDGVGRNEGKTG